MQEINVTKMTTKLDEALGYARRGWSVLPLYEPGGDGFCSCGNPECSSPAKHPRTTHGVLDATTNEARIRYWWEQWPNANIGVATGEKSGIMVLDIDSRHGGEESFAKLEAAHGKTPQTLECLTGGGGRHLYFIHPGAPVKNKIGFMPGLDIRGDGGYVVAPPSVHISGGLYQWKKTA
ncbi:MAG: bifunctional DNA primase/polymerase [Elusimicrobia bacterium]|nr:bifunctional DNA primase/polymerase [Elusimicrobiota bacterium]